MSYQNAATPKNKRDAAWRDRAMTATERAWWRPEKEAIWAEFSPTPAWLECPWPLLDDAARARFIVAFDDLKRRFIDRFGRG